MSSQINLLPKKDLASSLIGRILKFSLTYGRYIIVITQLIVLGAFFSRFRLDREVNNLNDAVTQKRAIVRTLSDFEQEVRLIQNKLIQIKNLKDSHDIIRNSLESIKTTLPPGNVLTRISIDQNSINIDGTSENKQSLALLVNQLSNSDKFSSVNMNKINNNSERNVIDFSAILVLSGIEKNNEKTN